MSNTDYHDALLEHLMETQRELNRLLLPLEKDVDEATRQRLLLEACDIVENSRLKLGKLVRPV